MRNTKPRKYNSELISPFCSVISEHFNDNIFESSAKKLVGLTYQKKLVYGNFLTFKLCLECWKKLICLISLPHRISSLRSHLFFDPICSTSITFFKNIVKEIVERRSLNSVKCREKVYSFQTFSLKV